MTQSGTTNNRRNHQFDLLRIIFANLVLLAHAPELTDGNRSREIFARVTGSNMTFGQLGVDGFFLLSGFLIVKSWQKDSSPRRFLSKRFLRIAPGYAAATLICTLVMGLLAPGVPHLFNQLNLSFVRSILFLFPPANLPFFPGNPYPVLNGSLWTILYEFRCYIFVALFGVLGLLHRRKVWLAATAVLLASLVSPYHTEQLPWPHFLKILLGDQESTLRLTAIFFVGGCFYLFRDKIQFRPLFAMITLLPIIAVCVLKPEHLELPLATFGAYLLFYFTQRPAKWLPWMGKLPDVSYGIYLYGFPVENFLIFKFHWSPWITFFVSTLLCFALGWLSYAFVEEPALSLKPKQSKPAYQLVS